MEQIPVGSHIANLQEMVKKGYFSYGGRKSESQAKFYNGECAMFTGSSASLANIRKNAKFAFGLSTLPSSLHHVAEPTTMLRLASYLQGIVLFQPDASLVAGVDWHFQVHMLLGMTIFLLFPFSRLVHVWSGFGTVAYLFRPYQMVSSRRLNVPARQNLPRRAS